MRDRPAFKPFAATVANLLQRFLQEETILRHENVDPTVPVRSHHDVMILAWRRFKNGELESALSVLKSMTSPRVATGFGQHGHDQFAKTDFRMTLESRNRHRNDLRGAIDGHGDFRLPVTRGSELAGSCDGDNRRVSKDSRSFDAIDDDAIIGRAFLRFWPPRKISFLR